MFYFERFPLLFDLLLGSMPLPLTLCLRLPRLQILGTLDTPMIAASHKAQYIHGQNSPLK